MFKLCLMLTSCFIFSLCMSLNENTENEETETNDPSSVSFFCSNGRQFLPPDSVCDGIENCFDGGDEDQNLCKTWKCDESIPFKCKKPFKCISNSWLCDKRKDCEDGSDEDSFLCLTKHINSTVVENDEEDYENQIQRQIEVNQSLYSRFPFHCEDGVGSIQLSKVCNGIEDCADKSDENTEFCKAWNCSLETPFRCGNTTQCIPDYLVCNGVTDCVEGIDEDQLFCDQHIKLHDIEKKLEEDVANEMKLFENLPLPYPFTCANRQGGIALEYVCDGNVDCDDRSDEDQEMCKGWKCAPEIPFKCKEYGMCISKKLLCDMKNDCPDGSDEENVLCAIPESLDHLHNATTIDMDSIEKLIR